MHVDLRCSRCGYVGRQHARDVTLYANVSDGFSLISARCPMCGDLAVNAGGDLDEGLAAAGARVRRLRRIR